LPSAQAGQLGHGDRVARNAPTLVPGLAGVNAVHAACGKARDSAGITRT
jgi:hypothetical protein